MAVKERKKDGNVQITAVFLQSVFLSLGLFLAGSALLAWAVSRGMAGEGDSFPILTGTAGISAFAGAWNAVRQRNGWGAFSMAAAETACFAAVLTAAGMLMWKEIAWIGHGGVLLAGCLAGGMAAGLAGGGRSRKKMRRHMR